MELEFLPISLLKVPASEDVDCPGEIETIMRQPLYIETFHGTFMLWLTSEKGHPELPVPASGQCRLDASLS